VSICEISQDIMRRINYAIRYFGRQE